MATITSNITATQTVIPVDVAVGIPDTFYTIDSEAIRLLGTSRGPDGRAFRRTYWSVDRGLAGTTAATHSSGASLTQYYPDAEGGGGGGGVVILTGNAFPPTVDDVGHFYRNGQGYLFINVGTLAEPDWNIVSAIGNLTGDAGFQASGANVVSAFGVAFELNAGPVPIGSDILSGEADPSAAAGVAAPIPALYLRKSPGVATELWYKTTGADTGWSKLTP
jgi:hypothetical protein